MAQPDSLNARRLLSCLSKKEEKKEKKYILTQVGAAEKEGHEKA